MSPVQNTTSELSSLLDREIKLSSDLLETLNSERSALESLDDRQIQLNTSSKHQLVNQLQEVTSKRIAWVDEHLESSPELIQGMSARFDQLQEIAQVCYEQNQLIGQLINRRSLFLINALNSMTPGAPHNDLTYTSKGKTGAATYQGELGIG